MAVLRRSILDSADEVDWADIASHHSSASQEAARILSTLPSLYLRVDALSYVETRLPCILYPRIMYVNFPRKTAAEIINLNWQAILFSILENTLLIYYISLKEINPTFKSKFSKLKQVKL